MPHSRINTFTALLFYFFIATPTMCLSNQPLNIPPRVQWEANFGYCGETSLISAGLYFGQYCSQYTARDIASPNVPQDQQDSQLLLGVNFEPTATAMRLKFNTFNTDAQRTSQDFVNWINRELSSNHPVIIGVFTNEYKFYSDSDKNAGDAEYDHIVPVLSLTSPRNGGVLTFSDNGLWTGSDSKNGPPPPFYFNFTIPSSFRTRAQANSPSAPVYSLKKDPSNYGISITGIVDTNKDTVPVVLTTKTNYESPEMKDGSSVRPAPMPLQLTATVKIPDQRVSYNLYMYDSFTSVPTSRFNAQASNAVKSWKIPANSGATYSVSLDTKSDQIVVFRAVRATAP